MERTFEDEFMDLHISMVQRVNEVIGDRVDTLYIYCCMEEDEKMFNAFYVKNGKAMHDGDLKIPYEDQGYMQSGGMRDMAEIEEVCKKHGKPSPTEIKMVYDRKSGGLRVQYRYEAYLEAEDKIAEDVYYAWMEEIDPSYFKEDKLSKLRAFFSFLRRKK